ncbi:hypothetical protein M9H77_32878 [Catharanthus roseus]|uniref:Uncharacterized protein n=1 Tax=Catharanthus roseus TaxID=4058 RepID=A0ACC0A4J9_CATRO|nr:hypothetical protein M9H77_32878 [Catharanthus roseus]
MVKVGCTLDGNLDNSKFNEPMPWIGIYIAAASAACAIAMAIDAFHGLRFRKFWFPCKFFTVNATTLTLLAVATKLSVDLNTSMPRRQDQLAKLSSTVFVCTVMANFMPALGTVNNKEMVMNLMALGIFVITVIVNICIQLATGVIYVFQREYAFTMFFMIVLLALMISSALTVPATKCYFDLKYKNMHKLAMKECNYKANRCLSKNVSHRLREDLTKYWMMAHTCNPQFVMGRIATCTASGAFCLLSTATLAEAMLRSYLAPWNFKFCAGESDYKWSTTLILIIQAIAVGVGTLAPASRWFIAVNFRCPNKAKEACKFWFPVENYWIRTLHKWKECPLVLRIYGRHCRKFAHSTKNKVLNFCTGMQIGIVLMSKLVRFICVTFVVRFLISSQIFRKLIRLLKCNNTVSSHDSVSDSQDNTKQHLRPYVMHLEGEKALIDMMIESSRDPVSFWIRMGQKKQPKHLLQLLEKLKSSQELKAVRTFDSDMVPPLESEEPPNCWALPVVTLTSIAVAVPNVDRLLVKQLIQGVHEALMYIRIIEDNLDAKLDLVNIRKAAEVVWVGVDLQYKWLDVDLHDMATQGKSSREVLEELADIAKQRFTEFRRRDTISCLRETPSQWPLNVLAANSMYRICQTLLQSSDSRESETGDRMFQRLCTMISEITGACLTNLQHVISTQCHQSTIEEREERVRNAILLLGKTEKILEILEQKPLPSSDPQQCWCIDSWRMSSKQRDFLHINSSSTNEDTSSSSSPDLYLTID